MSLLCALRAQKSPSGWSMQPLIIGRETETGMLGPEGQRDGEESTSLSGRWARGMGSRFEPLLEQPGDGSRGQSVGGQALSWLSFAGAPRLPPIAVCVRRPLYRAAHVERQAADSSSCCHLCSREQFRGINGC